MPKAKGLRSKKAEEEEKEVTPVESEEVEAKEADTEEEETPKEETPKEEEKPEVTVQSAPEKKKVPNVRVKPNQDIKTYIGDSWYNLKKGKQETVPQTVKDILQKAGMLDAL